MEKHRWMIRWAMIFGRRHSCWWLGAVLAVVPATPGLAEAMTVAPGPSSEVSGAESAELSAGTSAERPVTLVASTEPNLSQLLTSLASLPAADPTPSSEPETGQVVSMLPDLASSAAVPASTSANAPFQFTPDLGMSRVQDPMQPLVQPLRQPQLLAAPSIDIAVVQAVADPSATPADASALQISQAERDREDPLAPLAPPPAISSPAETPAAATSVPPLLSGEPITPPSLNLQGSVIQIGDEFSARARLRGYTYLSPNVMVGATVDLTTGSAFSDTDATGLGISELYIAASPSGAPTLRFAVGQLDLTSYFDRNSFAKDSLTHFFNPVFQTNPALSATQLQSQPAALVSWRATDDLVLKATTFSSGGIDDFSLDAFAGEVGVRFGDLILRGTYVSATDAGSRSSFPEIFQSNRGNGVFGTLPGDREVSYGVNAEWFIPTLNLGVFGRYGYQENQTLDLSGQTYSGGINLFDVFLADDRLGVGYGWGLSNDDLRQQQNGDTPDVFEVFYDVRLAPNIRAAVDFQQRNSFSETYLGVRVRADVELLNND